MERNDGGVTAIGWSSSSTCASSWVVVAVSVLAAVAMHSVTADRSGAVTFTCSNMDEYYYAVPGSRCLSYYRCNKNRTRLVIDCPPGATFDFFKQVCTRAAGICYEPVCTGRTDGVYQDTTHACRRSLTCRHGQLSAFDNCPARQLHDGRRCRPQDDVICNLPQSTAIAYPYSADRRCAGLPAGRHVAVGTACRRYVQCDAAAQVLDDVECADGWRFDERASQRQCVPVAQAGRCEGSTDGGLCRGLADGRNVDPMADACETYIRCAAGRFVGRESCPPQTVFDGRACILRPLYECPTERHFPKRDPCKHRADGMWPDPRLGCGSYVRCERGISAEPRMCGRDQFFDPELRRCVYNRGPQGCTVRASSAECQQLERGFYQDKSEASSCRGYFHCYNGQRTDYQCSAGRVFDGEACVAAATYVCPNKNPDSCAAKADGYYKDVHATCRAYYLCSQGRKYRYLCGETERFDGTECVRRKAGELCPNMGACAARPDGYYADVESRCRNYYFCLKQEVLTTLTCHGSRVYNGQKCVPAEEYRCPRAEGGGALESDDERAESQQIDCVRRPARCERQGKCSSDGFFADIATGCVEYYFCIGQTQSGVLRCGEGSVFNGEICVRREQYTCPQYCDGASEEEEDESEEEC